MTTCATLAVAANGQQRLTLLAALGHHQPRAMAASDLARVARSGLPHLPAALVAVIDDIASTRGTMARTAAVACSLGLRNRFALARLMHQHGLPGLRELSSWMRVLGWLIEAEATGEPLFVIATRSGRCPAASYRLTKRLTGLTWTELRAHGLSWVAEKLTARCREIGQQICEPSPPHPATSSRTPHPMPSAVAHGHALNRS